VRQVLVCAELAATDRTRVVRAAGANGEKTRKPLREEVDEPCLRSEERNGAQREGILGGRSRVRKGRPRSGPRDAGFLEHPIPDSSHTKERGRLRLLVEVELERVHERGRLPELVREAVEHQHPTAEPTRPNLEACTRSEGRIETHRPRIRSHRSRRGRVVVAVVEDGFEVPARSARIIELAERRLVAVQDSLRVPIRSRVSEPSCVEVERIDPDVVLGDVPNDHRVAESVVCRVEEPAVRPRRIVRIRDPRFLLATQAEDLHSAIARADAPMDAAVGVGPALGANGCRLDARPEHANRVPCAREVTRA
jgi:hypothetical protein